MRAYHAEALVRPRSLVQARTGSRLLASSDAARPRPCTMVAALGKPQKILTGGEHERFQQRPRGPRSDAAHGGAKKLDRKSTRLNSSHLGISYAVFCLKKKKTKNTAT